MWGGDGGRLNLQAETEKVDIEKREGGDGSPPRAAVVALATWIFHAEGVGSSKGDNANQRRRGKTETRVGN